MQLKSIIIAASVSAVLLTGCSRSIKDDLETLATTNQTTIAASTEETTETSGPSVAKASAGENVVMADMFNLSETDDMAVTFYFDVEEPTVTVISPDGSYLETDDLQTDKAEDAVCFVIEQAEPGQWYIICDKKSNTNVELDWAPNSLRTHPNYEE